MEAKGKEEKAKAPSPEVPKELIDRYKIALGEVTDLRLVVLLLFNSFEEIMKSFAAWRLGCSVEDLPRAITNTSSILFQVVLIESTSLRKVTQLFSELRNLVAHKFHQNEHEGKIIEFLDALKKHEFAGSVSVELTKDALVYAVFALALEVAAVMLELPERTEYPFPSLSLELVS